jgi:hypothetical protein
VTTAERRALITTAIGGLNRLYDTIELVPNSVEKVGAMATIALAAATTQVLAEQNERIIELLESIMATAGDVAADEEANRNFATALSNRRRLNDPNNFGDKLDSNDVPKSASAAGGSQS